MTRPEASLRSDFRGRVKRGRDLGFMAGAMLGAALHATLPTRSAEARPDSVSEAFPILMQRNIFDPTRTASRPPTEEPPDRPREPSRAQFLTLTGTMLYRGNAYAFFGGSDPSYRQVVSLQNQIANLTVGEITTAHVVLHAETNQWILPVGRQLQRSGDTIWELSTAAQAAPPEPGAGETAQVPRDDSDQTGPPPAPSGEVNELLKRLMERREKEMSP